MLQAQKILAKRPMGKPLSQELLDHKVPSLSLGRLVKAKQVGLNFGTDG
jgi:hypothetical protein